jgi:hypothetical protein
MMAAMTLAAGAAASQGRPDLVRQVAEGELTEARASWWGFDPVDATETLQAAINSGVPRLMVDDLGQPWSVRPISLHSNQEVVFAKGVVVEARKGEFHGRGDCLLSANLQENIVLRGDGATLRMHRDDYEDPALYEPAEWRHVLSIRSSRNIQVHGLTLASSGGDGIYLGVSEAGVPNQDIVIRDVICDRNYRQGISVISARRLLIENCVVRNTGGTDPAAGIDLEPNGPSEELVDCLLRNCLAENNEGDAYLVYLPNLHASSAPISIRLENCRARNGNRNDFGLVANNSTEETVQGLIEVVGCRFSGARSSAVRIRGKAAAGALVRFESCVVDTPAATDASAVPVVIQSRVGDRRQLGGVDLGDLVVNDPLDRPFLDYEDWSGAAGLVNVTGTLRVQGRAGETVHELTDAWLDAAFPTTVRRSIPPLSLEELELVPAQILTPQPNLGQEPFYLRQGGTLVLSAAAGGMVRMVLRHTRVGKSSGQSMQITALCPSGLEIAAGQVPLGEEAEIVFRAPESGLYRLPISAGVHRLAPVRSSHPVAVSGENGAVHFIGAAGDLYFLVPAGTAQFGLLIYGESKGEAIAAAIHDPAGNLVWERDPITLPELFAPQVPAASRDQVWRLRLSLPTGLSCEDNYVDLRGIPPFLARDPRALLTVKR